VGVVAFFFLSARAERGEVRATVSSRSRARDLEPKKKQSRPVRKSAGEDARATADLEIGATVEIGATLKSGATLESAGEDARTTADLEIGATVSLWVGLKGKRNIVISSGCYLAMGLVCFMSIRFLWQLSQKAMLLA
jgi:hypothetical protein